MNLEHVGTELGMEILSFLDWKDRGRCLTLNKSWAHLPNEEGVPRYFCHWLQQQDGVYFGNILQQKLPPESTWNEVFTEMFSTRNFLMTGERKLTRFQVNVHLRLCPKQNKIVNSDEKKAFIANNNDDELKTATNEVKNNSNNENDDFKPQLDLKEGEREKEEKGSSRIVIPLHQRLRLIQQQHKCSKQQAYRILWNQSNDSTRTDKGVQFISLVQQEADKAKSANSDKNDDKDNDNYSSTSEYNSSNRNTSNSVSSTNQNKNKNALAGIQSVEPGILSVEKKRLLMCVPRVGIRAFEAKDCFDQDAKQESVYMRTTQWHVRRFLNGENGCVICYGQTGSGKTYTLFGPDMKTASSLDIGPDTGIVPRVCKDLLSSLRRRVTITDSKLSFACVEVFGDQVHDLLSDEGPGAQVGAWHGVAAGAILRGDASIVVTDDKHMEELLMRSDANKRKAATALNERSSRAHTICIFELVQTHHQTGTQLVSRLCLADLGGAEQLKQSQVTGEQMQEATKINQGLFALKKCMTALNEKKDFIPFQSSNLTKLLSTSLRGACHTSVVVTGRQEPEHVYQTLQSFRFGETCSGVNNEALRNTGAASYVIQALSQVEQEIKQVQALIEQKERWTDVKKTRVDQDGTVETVITSIPMGAEEERQRLDLLLARQRQLISV